MARYRTYSAPAPIAHGVRLDQVEFSRHMLTQAATKGFTKEQIISALTKPEKVTDVTRYPGQKRWCGAGIAIVMEPLGNGRWSAVTAYLDGVITERRADQVDSAAMTSRRLASVGY